MKTANTKAGPKSFPENYNASITIWEEKEFRFTIVTQSIPAAEG
jgi:hypothetical protein